VLCLQSTVVNLLENFYAPQRGQILLDGTPLDAIDHEYLHSQISLVSQEPVLFAGTFCAYSAWLCNCFLLQTGSFADLHPIGAVALPFC
jgi:ABC-type sugar transport system ATPase subunit